MARDFQLPTAGVFQNVQSMIIYNPGDGRHPSVSSGAPSFVGSITIMNSFGVSCAEDTLRSADANAQVPGAMTSSLFFCASPSPFPLCS